MRLVFIGVQGSGKGTQAKIISEKLKIPHISTGELLRKIKGELKEEVDSCMSKGILIPDELMIRILKERISNEDCKRGFILDGFPRNLKQAEILDEEIKIDRYFEISISDEEALNRLAGRLNCSKCGRSYHIRNRKPNEEGKCDSCGGELYTREDDNEDAIKERIKWYHKETEPILEKYNSTKINGEQSVEKVAEDILNELK